MEAPEKHHVHHSYIWLGSLRVIFIILLSAGVSLASSMVPIIAEAGSMTPEDIRIGLIVMALSALAVLLIIVFVVVYQVVSYKHLWYELGEEEFSLYSGIFSKKRVHVPYRRIQSVDQRASLLQRIFGVCSVSIDTAGGSNNKAVQVPYVRKSQAEELRAELFMRKAACVSEEQARRVAAQTPSNVLDAPAGLWDEVRGVFAGEEVETGRVTYEYGLSNKELVLTGLSNNTKFALVLLAVFAAASQMIGGIVPLLFSEASPAADVVLKVAMKLFGGSLMATGIAFTVGIVLLLWIVSAVGSCISYGGFRCCRRDNRIEVERGLLQHQFQGVNVDRVQSVTVKQTFIRRLFGYCELSLGKIDAVQEGSDGQQGVTLQQGLVIHPFVKMSRVPEILAGIIPEFADVPTDVRPVPPVAKRRAVIRRVLLQGGGFWLVVLVALMQVTLNLVAGMPEMAADPGMVMVVKVTNVVAAVLYVLAVVLMVIDVVGALLWHKESGFAFNRAFMQVSNGGLTRETVCFPRKKIQFGYTRMNPLQRRAKTATLNVRTAAGVGGTTIRLIDASQEDATAWLAWLEPHGNVIE